MPGAGGVEMIRNIRKQDPWVKVIYMSGDLLSFLSVLDEEKRKYPVLILPKPFSREDLLNRLAELGNGGNHGSSLHTPQSQRMADRKRREDYAGEEPIKPRPCCS
jgi:CheY-like chemotaxis protein